MYSEQTKPDASVSATAVCSDRHGKMPGLCAPLAFPYVPTQMSTSRYANKEALQQGTLFPGLDLPFRGTGKTGNLSDSALHRLMAIDFAVDELGLYLTTHSEDQEALALYDDYRRMAQELRQKYEVTNGPLLQTSPTNGAYRWLQDPWPWDEGGNR